MTGVASVTTTRILVVDDHNTFAELLTGALDREHDLSSVGHATTGAEGVAMYARLDPDVVLMDVQLPGTDGFDATAQILALRPDARVILLTAIATAAVAARAASSGACGFLAKEGHLEDMLRIVRSARPGGFSIDPALLTRLARQRVPEVAPLQHQLTDRELEVLALLGDGKDVTRIARELSISNHTCRWHIKSLLAKLEAHSQLEALVIAVRKGLIDISEGPQASGGW